MVTFPYNTTDFAFTLDNVFVEFSSDIESVYFSVIIDITYFDFYSSTENTKTTYKKVPLFQNNGKLNIGSIVHRHMSDISELVDTEIQYQPAKVTITAHEFSADLQEILNTDILEDVQFIAGYSPTRVYNNIALLHRNTNPCRITAQGFVNVSFLLPTGTHILKTYKNQEEVASEQLQIAAGENIITKKIDASAYGAQKGDFFKVKIHETLVFYEFVVFPAGAQSNMLVFLNEYKLKSSLELTGGYVVDASYSQVEESVYENLVKVLKVIETTKTETISINTGYLLQSDVVTLDSLLMHKKAWLITSENQTLELVPKAKKLKGTDSTKELYEYTLTFTINAPNDAQNYTF